jgi:hypothetical protein
MSPLPRSNSAISRLRGTPAIEARVRWVNPLIPRRDNPIGV